MGNRYIIVSTAILFLLLTLAGHYRVRHGPVIRSGDELAKQVEELAYAGRKKELERLVFEGNDAKEEVNMIASEWGLEPKDVAISVAYHPEASYQGTIFFSFNDGSVRRLNIRQDERGWRLNIGCPKKSDVQGEPTCAHPRF